MITDWFQDLFDFIRFYRTRHPGLFWMELLAVVLILLIIIWQLISAGKSRSTRKAKKRSASFSFSGRLIFLIAALIAASIPFILRISGWFSQEEEIVIPAESGYVFGIDVSHYSGSIDWKKVSTTHHPIRFVVMRSTMGSNGKDRQFQKNWREAGMSGYIRGAYHYYRPGDDPVLQFRNYVRTVALTTGDLRPVLDIERSGRLSDEKLRAGVLEWLSMAEEKFGVKPIVYTGLNFYRRHLEGYLNDYPLWIAAYDGEHRLNGVRWTIHQFTDRLSLAGVGEYVDANHFKGTQNEFNTLCIP